MTTLDRLLAEQAIVELTVRYCRALDERDFEKLRQIFLPDCTALYGPIKLEGVEAVMARCSEALDLLDASQHIVTNHQVTIDAERAVSRCYFHAQHVRYAAADTDRGPHFIVAGRYEDQLVRVNSDWRIRHRVLTAMWTQGNPSVVNPTLGRSRAPMD
jgi:3-phenylpropionate/cinnamic acid dioxygenase small subunit